MNNDHFNIPADREIVTTRVMNAAREKVFRAWTDPAILQQWWGPAGFTNTFYEFDPVPGGKWKFMMHGPEKGNYPNEVKFLRVEEPSLIAWDRITQPHFRVVTTFEAMDSGKTKLTFRMQFNSAEECDKLKKFVVDKNEENFDKLERILKTMDQ